MSLASSAERYRARAARLRIMLRRMRYPETRLQLLCLIKEFEALADHADRRKPVSAPRGATILPFRRAS